LVLVSGTAAQEDKMSAQTTGILASLSDELSNAVEHISKSLVSVHARRRFPSSGVIWNENTIITADHVIEREEDLAVTLPDGQKVQAKLAGRDPNSDIALLTLAEPKALTPASRAEPNSLKIGHFVLAVGRPSAPMASFGVVSALGGSLRTARGGRLESYIKADVGLYPGFSGGALINTQGQLVGLNSAQITGNQAAAIPLSVLQSVILALSHNGKIKRAFLGVMTQPIQLPKNLQDKLGREQDTALIILRAEPNSPAEQAGLQLGDIVVSLSGKPISDIDDLQNVLGQNPVGKATSLSILRGGNLTELSIIPGERN
jgi:S1-C subfamily serine protease